ncbi:hypothetical protein KMT30_10330 [Streptomyces sp. IBSBF 2953]|nr:hypothetical protein [Streptomyces hayashii]
MDVVRLLGRHRNSGLPVVHDGKLVEVVCETDLIRRERPGPQTPGHDGSGSPR